MAKIDAIQLNILKTPHDTHYEPLPFEYDALVTIEQFRSLEGDGVVDSAAVVTEGGAVRILHVGYGQFAEAIGFKQWSIQLCTGEWQTISEAARLYVKLDTLILEDRRDRLQAKIDRINALKIQPVTTD